MACGCGALEGLLPGATHSQGLSSFTVVEWGGKLDLEEILTFLGKARQTAGSLHCPCAASGLCQPVQLCGMYLPLNPGAPGGTMRPSPSTDRAVKQQGSDRGLRTSTCQAAHRQEGSFLRPPRDPIPTGNHKPHPPCVLTDCDIMSR